MDDDNFAGGVWIDEAWLDTVVVVGVTCFVLCLMGLSKVRMRVFHVALSSVDDLFYSL